MQASKQIFTVRKNRQNRHTAGEQIQYAPWCCHTPTQRDGFPALSRCVGSEDGQCLASYDAEREEQTKVQLNINHTVWASIAPSQYWPNTTQKDTPNQGLLWLGYSSKLKLVIIYSLKTYMNITLWISYAFFLQNTTMTVLNWSSLCYNNSNNMQ